MAKDDVWDDPKYKGFSRYFNSYTIRGRSNWAKLWISVYALSFLAYKVIKKGPDENSKNMSRRLPTSEESTASYLTADQENIQSRVKLQPSIKTCHDEKFEDQLEPEPLPITQEPVNPPAVSQPSDPPSSVCQPHKDSDMPSDLICPPCQQQCSQVAPPTQTIPNTREASHTQTIPNNPCQPSCTPQEPETPKEVFPKTFCAAPPTQTIPNTPDQSSCTPQEPETPKEEPPKTSCTAPPTQTIPNTPDQSSSTPQKPETPKEEPPKISCASKCK